ncbi:MAG: bifunctional glutamate N-acetyltransferase/amino-acid acetyltransferase ArgJ [Desulfobacteraceae bacterium]|nr:bifunctional glutamate N-acetyltransferase/amino-acid acetyltransferase ArgJ [Desulfobacteraceae bacterium]
MKGFKFSGISAGIKADDAMDLGIIYSERPARAAALFTQNQVVAPPVILGRERIKTGLCQAIVVNSGNANCFTGAKGLADAEKTAELAGKALGIAPELVMVSSTGVIGAPLPMEKIEQGVPELVRTMNSDGTEAFATAILTTDLTAKVSTRRCSVKGGEFTITGVAKGSGMIKPNMATMLAFVVTDLDIPTTLLQACLKKACDRSFNRISVDGDTSTNDSVFALANGMSQAVLEDSDDSLEFQRLLDEVLLDLSEKIVKDGEGATKLVKITVKGAKTPEDALKVAETVAQSNLVKTAIYGEDPNWGRIVAAAGRSGALVEPEKLDLKFGDVALVKAGEWQGKDAEKEAAGIMKGDEIELTLDLNIGEYGDWYLFCDFSENYVKINADYRS